MEETEKERKRERGCGLRIIWRGEPVSRNAREKERENGAKGGTSRFEER